MNLIFSSLLFNAKLKQFFSEATLYIRFLYLQSIMLFLHYFQQFMHMRYVDEQFCADAQA